MYRSITPNLYDVVSVRMPEINENEDCDSIEWVGICNVEVDRQTRATSIELPPMRLSQRALLLLPVGPIRLKLRISHETGPAIQIDGLANKSGRGIGSRVISKAKPTVEAWTRVAHDPQQSVRAITRSVSQGAKLQWEIVEIVVAEMK